MKKVRTFSMEIWRMAKKEFLLSLLIFFIGLSVLIFELYSQWAPSLFQ